MVLLSSPLPQFETVSVSGFDFTIDGTFSLQEVGFVMYPSFAFHGWNAQFWRFQSTRDETLSSLLTYVVPIFTDQVMNGSVTVTVYDMPLLSVLQQQRYVLLDLSLGCPTAFDSSCAGRRRSLVESLVNDHMNVCVCVCVLGVCLIWCTLPMCLWSVIVLCCVVCLCVFCLFVCVFSSMDVE
jgi:hypothetical protein